MIYIENKSVYKNHTCVICQKGHNANISVCDFTKNKTHVFPKNKSICDLSALMSQTGSLRHYCRINHKLIYFSKKHVFYFRMKSQMIY